MNPGELVWELRDLYNLHMLLFKFALLWVRVEPAVTRVEEAGVGEVVVVVKRLLPQPLKPQPPLPPPRALLPLLPLQLILRLPLLHIQTLLLQHLLLEKRLAETGEETKE